MCVCVCVWTNERTNEHTHAHTFTGCVGWSLGKLEGYGFLAAVPKNRFPLPLKFSQHWPTALQPSNLLSDQGRRRSSSPYKETPPHQTKYYIIFNYAGKAVVPIIYNYNKWVCWFIMGFNVCIMFWVPCKNTPWVKCCCCWSCYCEC